MAMRMPISRVRSVTETSMMFMMPMPPTTSDTAATPPSSMVSVWLTLWDARDDVGVVADREVVGLAGRRACGAGAAASVIVRGDRVDLVGRRHLDDDRVERGRAEQAHLAGLERDQDRIVLVPPKPLRPWLASTPTTVNGTLRMRISWPTGSWPSGNRLVATVWPRTRHVARVGVVLVA